MKRFTLLLTLICFLVPTAYIVAAEAAADDATVLEGEYLWTRRDISGPVEAHFTPTGENTFDVSFQFQFRGETHIYSGTAEGSLTDGPLSGTVKNESNVRTFTFKGKASQGVFKGEHAEIRDSGVIDTGTIELKG